MLIPPWLSQIRTLQSKESNFVSSNWVQLATIGIDNKPRVRTVVFRGWSESYEMEIYTDKRSQKYDELDLNNNVEICWLFLESKCQFRFRGLSRIDLGIDKHRHWDQLSEKSKSMWSWPCPGEQYVFDQKKLFPVTAKEDKLSNFILLKIQITHVDQLLLDIPVHIRRRWLLNNDWIEERINP